MSTDAQAVASSATENTPPPTVSAVDAAVASNDVASYREARRAERSGKPLESKPAASTPAEPAEQAASTDATESPASETGKPRKNAETRVQELLAERAKDRERLAATERRLAELEGRAAAKPDAKPAESSPAPEQPKTFPSYDEYLTKHPDASYEDYLDARADFRADQRFEQRKADEARQAERQRASQSERERDERFEKQVKDAVTADPEFLSKCSDEVLALKPFSAIRDERGRWTEKPTGFHAIADEITGSDVAPQLMRHFSDHPEELQRIAKLMPRDLLKEMGKLEAKFAKGDTPAAPAKAPLKLETSAPEPATQLGKRPMVPADPLEAAVAANDVGAYRRARLAQRTAGMR